MHSAKAFPDKGGVMPWPVSDAGFRYPAAAVRVDEAPASPAPGNCLPYGREFAHAEKPEQVRVGLVTGGERSGAALPVHPCEHSPEGEGNGRRASPCFGPEPVAMGVDL